MVSIFLLNTPKSEFASNAPARTKGKICVIYILPAYIEAALELARYDKLDDGSFAGEIPRLKSVAAFGKTLRECEGELRSTLEDWILAGLRLGHKLPVLTGIDLNKVSHGRLTTT